MVSVSDRRYTRHYENQIVRDTETLPAGLCRTRRRYEALL
jgi:hypothetical protein